MYDSNGYSTPSPAPGPRHNPQSPIRGSSGQEIPCTPSSSRTYHIRRPMTTPRAVLRPIDQAPSSGTGLASVTQPDKMPIASNLGRYPNGQSPVNSLEAILSPLSGRTFDERFPFIHDMDVRFDNKRLASGSTAPETLKGPLESGSVDNGRSGLGSRYGHTNKVRMQRFPTDRIHAKPVFQATAIICPPYGARPADYCLPPFSRPSRPSFTLVNNDGTLQGSNKTWSPANQAVLLGHRAHNSIDSTKSFQTTSSKPSSVSDTTAQPSNRGSLATTPENTAADPVKSGFIPMGQVQGYRALGQLDPDYQRLIDQQKERAGISKGYGGDPFNPANQSADVPESESTALWITNLPPDCDHRALLTAVRRCGKIFACVVNPPTAGAGGAQQHMTAAAKLVFFDRPGADSLLLQSHRGEFKVGGFVPRVRLNRIRSAAREPGPHSRVLHIEGPVAVVNIANLLRFFSDRFSFEIEDIVTLNVADASPPRVRQEWRFGSFRCQAEAARQSIHREKERIDLPEHEKALWDQVNVHFGVDPCAP